MRLTEKKENGYAPELPPADPLFDRKQQFIDAYKSITNKLGQLEDYEEELGIDLFTFLKMFIQENIYIKCMNEIFENDVEITINCDKKGYFINLEVCHFDPLYLKDYGITWALTREELL